MRTVFTNAECCHVWAAQNQSEGKNSSGSIFFHEAVIYSYGPHFPMAGFVNSPNAGRVVLATTATYSSTTAAHMSSVWRALHGLPNVSHTFHVPNVSPIGPDHEANATHYSETMADLLGKAARARKYGPSYLESAGTLADEANAYAAAFGLEWDTFTSPDGLDEARERAAAYRQAETDRRTAAEVRNICERYGLDTDGFSTPDEATTAAAVVVAKRFSMWRDGIGETVHVPEWAAAACGIDPRYDYCRVTWTNGSATITTTRGAVVRVNGTDEVDRASRVRMAYVWGQSRAARAAGGFVSVDGLRLGHYAVDSVNADGSVRIGCHVFPADEVDRVAVALKLDAANADRYAARGLRSVADTVNH